MKHEGSVTYDYVEDSNIKCYTMQCSPSKVNRLFGRTCRLHLQDLIVSQSRKEHEAGLCSMMVS
jgi:hypothetical protein